MNHDTHSPITLYRRGCRCSDCSTAYRRYDKRRRQSPPRVVDAKPARDYLRLLLREGMPIDAIAKQLGYEHSASVYQMMKRPKIRATTAHRALSVTYAPGEASNFVPARGTVRRIRALMAMGHQLNTIARMSGINVAHASDLLNNKMPTVKQATYMAVKATFEELQDTHGPSVRNRLRGKRERWAVPAAWDDIDNPNERRG